MELNNLPQKDNILFVVQAVRAARSVCGFSSKMEVECRSVDEGREAAAAGADIVMLDNFQAQVENLKRTQVIFHFHCSGSTHSATAPHWPTSPPPCLSPTGAPCCSSSPEDGVPSSTDRSQWRSYSRELSFVFLPTCGHHFPGLYNTGLSCCGLFSQGSKSWCHSSHHNANRTLWDFVLINKEENY